LLKEDVIELKQRAVERTSKARILEVIRTKAAEIVSRRSITVVG
jgi:hypothetical protein